jgi:hypothetical protein
MAKIRIALKLFDLKAGQCRFPTGEDESVRFCGQPIIEAGQGSYCADHYRLCYASSRPRISLPAIAWQR